MIVSPQGGIKARLTSPLAEHQIHQPGVIGVNLRLLSPGDGGRFVVGPFAQTHTAPPFDESLQILFGAEEIRLQGKSQILKFVQQAVKDVEGALRIRRAFHIHFDDIPQRASGLGNGSHLVAAKILAKIQTHVGQLDGNGGLYPLVGDALQKFSILPRCALGVLLGGDVLAQVVEGGQDASAVQLPHDGNRFVQRFAGDKAACCATGRPEVSDKSAHRFTVRQSEEETAQHSVSLLRWRYGLESSTTLCFR